MSLHRRISPSRCAPCVPTEIQVAKYYDKYLSSSTSTTLSTAQLQLGGSKHLSVPVNLRLRGQTIY